MFWTGKTALQDASPLHAACYSSIVKYHPDCTILSDSDIVPMAQQLGHLQVTPEWLAQLTVQQRSDIARLLALIIHGGVYIDATVLLRRDLSWVLPGECDITGFLYLGNVMENWFIAVRKPHNPLITAWLAAFLTMLPHVTDSHIWKNLKSKSHSHPYFSQHAAYQWVVQNNPELLSNTNLDARPASGHATFIHTYIRDFLGVWRCDLPFLKFTGRSTKLALEFLTPSMHADLSKHAGYSVPIPIMYRAPEIMVIICIFVWFVCLRS
jgi:hypothetical protein